MKDFDKQGYQNFLIQSQIIGFCKEPILLKSKRESYWYANFRKLSSSYELLQRAANYIVDFLMQSELPTFDAILGIPEGASLLGYKVQEVLIEKKVVVDKIFQVRLKPKKHGDIANRYWVNGNTPQKVWLLEDVLTTGISAIEFIQNLGAMNINIMGLLSLLDRNQLNQQGESAAEFLKKEKIQYYSLTTAKDILPTALEKLPTKEKILFSELILQEYQNESHQFAKECPFYKEKGLLVAKKIN